MLMRAKLILVLCVLTATAQFEADVAMGEVLEDDSVPAFRSFNGQSVASEEAEDAEFFSGIRDDAMMQQVLSDLNGLETAIERQKLTRGGNVSDMALETMAGMKRFVDLKRLIAWLQPVDKRISRYCYYGCWCLPAGAHRFVTGQGRPVDEVDKACMYLWFCYTCARQEFGNCNPDTRRYSRQMTWDADAPGDHSKRGIRCTNQWRRYNRQSKYNCARAICECDRGVSVRLFAHWRTWSKRRHRLWSASMATPFTVETHCLKPDTPSNGPDQDFVCCGRYGDDGSRWPTRDQGGFRACCNKPVTAGLPWNGLMYSTITEDCCEADGTVVPMGDTCTSGPTDPDECTLGTHDCTGVDHMGNFDAAAAAVATCHNADGYFFCTCDSVYYALTPQIGMHGKHQCRDIDECHVDNSPQHDCGGVGMAGNMAAMCTNVNPGWSCACMGLFTLQSGVTGDFGLNSCVCDTSINRHLDGMDCKINECVCPNGMAVSQANCPNHDEEKCMSCNDGYTLVGQVCVPNQCVCDGGMAVPLGDPRCDNDGDNTCMSCSAGYTNDGPCNDADGCLCGANTCFCDNGDEVTKTGPSALCANEGDHTCASCDGGYTLNLDNPDQCGANDCTCANGMPVTMGGPNVLCVNDGDHTCQSCSAGYTLHLNTPNQCGPNECTCDTDGGTNVITWTTSGTDICTTDSTTQCRSDQCDPLYHIDGTDCLINVCHCTDDGSSGGAACGTPTPSCTSHGANICVPGSCHAGFNDDTNPGQCDPNNCQCESGAGTVFWSTDLPSDICNADLSSQCLATQCAALHHFDTDACPDNECHCTDDGTAGGAACGTTSPTCIVHGSNVCVPGSCFAGFNDDSSAGQCDPNNCQCDPDSGNSAPVAWSTGGGDVCNTNLGAQCLAGQCGASHTFSSDACVPDNNCICTDDQTSGGSPAGVSKGTLGTCSQDADNQCVLCSDRFAFVDGSAQHADNLPGGSAADDCIAVTDAAHCIGTGVGRQCLDENGIRKILGETWVDTDQSCRLNQCVAAGVDSCETSIDISGC